MEIVQKNWLNFFGAGGVYPIAGGRRPARRVNDELHQRLLAHEP